MSEPGYLSCLHATTGVARRCFAVLALGAGLAVSLTAQAAVHFHVAASEVHDFSDGLALVVVNGKYGFIDLAGKTAIKPAFEYADDFHDGLALVKEGGRYGFIDRAGKFVIAPGFDAASFFGDGLAPVKIGGQWGYIDRSGKVVIEARYESAGAFAEGVAPVALAGKYAFVDQTGKMVVPAKFNGGAFGRVHEGLALVQGGLLQIGQSAVATNKYGFVNHDGNVVIEPQFADAGNFGNGLAPIRKSDKYGYIEHSGKVAIAPQFDEAGAFSEELARVRVGAKFGFIDKHGAWVINPSFDEAGDFRHGLARVKSSGEWYFIDRGGMNAAAQPKVAATTPTRTVPVEPAPAAGVAAANQVACPSTGGPHPVHYGDLRYCLNCRSNAEIIVCVEKAERAMKHLPGGSPSRATQAPSV
ncbi:MAG TPA: WG repeat-containing protein [Terriglobales bacterium]|nr:WG repeat-containing protein [Terriglobales bacterium]